MSGLRRNGITAGVPDKIRRLHKTSVSTAAEGLGTAFHLEH